MAVISLPLPRQEQANRWASTPCIGALKTSVGRIRLTVFRDFRSIENQWCALQERGICAQAQTYAQAEAWFRLVSMADGAEPAIVCGHAESGELQFVWPFEVRDIRRTRCLSWIGAEHASYNMGCYSLSFARGVTSEDMRALINHTAQLVDVSAVRFDNQPFERNGVSNPMALLPHQPSANEGHVILLDQDFDTLYRNRFGGKSRNESRRKERRLRQEWDVQVGWAETPAERRTLLDELFRQNCAQIACASQRAFYHELASTRTDLPGRLEIAYVKTDDQYAAISCGIRFKDRITTLLTSTHDGPTRKYSPGSILLRRQIEHACRKGLNFFDMGAGDVRRKSAWCDVDTPLFRSVMAFDQSGYAVTAQGALIGKTKRFIETRPAMVSFIRNMSRKMHGRTVRQPLRQLTPPTTVS